MTNTLATEEDSRTAYVSVTSQNPVSWRIGVAAVGMSIAAIVGPGTSQIRPQLPTNSEPFSNVSHRNINRVTPILGRSAKDSIEPRTFASRCISDLKDWLVLSDDELAALTGVSRRSITSWRAGSSAYGATVRNLIGLHALISRLRTHLGTDGTLLWLVVDQFDGKSALEVLAADPEALSKLVSRAAPVLFSDTQSSPTLVIDELQEQTMLEQLRRVPGVVQRRSPHRPRRVARRR